MTGRADGAKRVIAGGGDGTINAVVNALDFAEASWRRVLENRCLNVVEVTRLVGLECAPHIKGTWSRGDDNGDCNEEKSTREEAPG